MGEAIAIGLADREQRVRTTALGLIPTLALPEERSARLLASVLGRRSVEEQQQALAVLGTLHSAPAHDVLREALNQLIAGTLLPARQLDLREAVEASTSEALQARLAQYPTSQPADDVLAAFRETLHGGNVNQGRRIFYRNEAAQCVRCHAIRGRGGDVGPDVTQVGSDLTREQLLESLVAPSARLAPGYGTVSLTLRDGQTLRGTLRAETDTHLVVATEEDEPTNVAKETIAERQDAPSSMPPMGAVLSRREIRDVIAVLTTLR